MCSKCIPGEIHFVWWSWWPRSDVVVWIKRWSESLKGRVLGVPKHKLVVNVKLKLPVNITLESSEFEHSAGEYLKWREFNTGITDFKSLKLNIKRRENLKLRNIKWGLHCKIYSRGTEFSRMYLTFWIQHHFLTMRVQHFCTIKHILGTRNDRFPVLRTILNWFQQLPCICSELESRNMNMLWTSSIMWNGR
jgi:hypothetical protein